MPGVVDQFPEKGEDGASIDPIGSVRVYVVTELKEPGNDVMVPT
jgi:hypothetical protein